MARECLVSWLKSSHFDMRWLHLHMPRPSFFHFPYCCCFPLSVTCTRQLIKSVHCAPLVVVSAVVVVSFCYCCCSRGIINLLANCLLAALAAAAAVAAAAAAVQCLQCSQHLPLSFAHFLHDSTNICAAFSLVFPLADMICFPLPLLPPSLSLCSAAHLSRLSDFLCRQAEAERECAAQLIIVKSFILPLCMRKSMQPASSLPLRLLMLPCKLLFP